MCVCVLVLEVDGYMQDMSETVMPPVTRLSRSVGGVSSAAYDDLDAHTGSLAVLLLVLLILECGLVRL